MNHAGDDFFNMLGCEIASLTGMRMAANFRFPSIIGARLIVDRLSP